MLFQLNLFKEYLSLLSFRKVWISKAIENMPLITPNIYLRCCLQNTYVKRNSGNEEKGCQPYIYNGNGFGTWVFIRQQVFEFDSISHFYFSKDRIYYYLC